MEFEDVDCVVYEFLLGYVDLRVVMYVYVKCFMELGGYL